MSAPRFPPTLLAVVFIQALSPVSSFAVSTGVFWANTDDDGDGYLDSFEDFLDTDRLDRNDVSKIEERLLSLRLPAVEKVLSQVGLYTQSDVDSAAQSARTIVNVSARVALDEGEIVTPGFVVLGEQKKILIRAVGPKLTDLGVGSPLPNPKMTIYKSRWDGNPPDVVASVDDWKADNDNVSEIVTAMSSAGAFPLEPAETFQGRPFMTDDTSSAAAFVTLDVGVYTVQVSSADDGVGEVLVEVYEITE